MGDVNDVPGAHTWQVPDSADSFLELEARPGEVITVVGANGAGKSALATWLAERTDENRLRRVLAQRRVWFQSSGPSISPADREKYFLYMESWDRSADSRIVDHADAYRGDIAMFDLLGKIGAENRKASDLVHRGGLPTQSDIDALGSRVSDRLNSVLERAGIIVTIELTEWQAFVAKHRELGVEYPIAQMSDGERAALLLAAEILVSPAGSIIMLDEPERHLHRSISARLIEALVDARPDCAFVIFTHDLDLAGEMAARPGKVYVTLGVAWDGTNPQHWQIQQLESSSSVPASARQSILGGRRQILFVEGVASSLDVALYRVLFPDWAVTPSGSCESVIRSVTGLSGSDAYHWVHAAGIVDGDGRGPDERAALLTKGVHVLPVSEVESLYYRKEVLAEVARNQAGSTDEEASALLNDAVAAGLKALGERATLEGLAHKVAKSQITRSLLDRLPDDLRSPYFSLKVESPYEDLLARFRTLHQDADYDELVKLAPVRDSPFRTRVAKSLGFLNPNWYQKAALGAIEANEELRARLAEWVAKVP